MPACCACNGPENSTSVPLSAMDPESIAYTPVRALIRVDLPAPFSPINACTSPGNSRNDTSDNARTPGKVMVMPLIWTTGCAGPGRGEAPAAGADAWVTIVLPRASGAVVRRGSSGSIWSGIQCGPDRSVVDRPGPHRAPQ